MIRHIVVAKFKPETSPAEIEEIFAGLRKLPEQIPDIIGYEFGLDEVHGERSCDFALVSTFQDIEAQNRYQINPIHLVTARRLRAASQHLVTVDFQV